MVLNRKGKKRNKINWKVLTPHLIVWSILAITAVVGVMMAGNIVDDLGSDFSERPKQADEEIEELVFIEPDLEIEIMDASDWHYSKLGWFGFSIKYPSTWTKKPSEDGAKLNKKYEYKYIYRNDEAEIFLGYDVKVYSKKKAGSFLETDEILDVTKLENISNCQVGNDILLGKANYNAKEVYVGQENNCFEETFFYSLEKGDYVYNIVPVLAENFQSDRKFRNELIENMPEFFTAAHTFQFIPIERPKPVKRFPGATYPAPFPDSYKVKNGKLVCKKKDDKPGKSKQGKSQHWDQQCCLDPDEWPNPFCTYDPEILRKFGF